MLLETERLKIHVAQPHSFPDTTFRFDRAGFVTSILLDGRYEFCANEPTNLTHPSSGGVGLCNEYLFHAACDEVQPGERFPKFGIGLFLKPDDQPYCFHRKYDARLFPITWEEKKDEVTFYTAPVLCNGYALEQKKILTVRDNCLTMRVELKNQGEKSVEMREYCHNFLTLDHLPLGPSYQLDIPAMKDRGTEVLDGTIRGNGRGFGFTAYNPQAAQVRTDPDEIDDTECFPWVLRHLESPVSIHGQDGFKPQGSNMWCIDHIISLETYRGIALKPGESTAWTRQWVFRDEKDEK